MSMYCKQADPCVWRSAISGRQQLAYGCYSLLVQNDIVCHSENINVVNTDAIKVQSVILNVSKHVL